MALIVDRDGACRSGLSAWLGRSGWDVAETDGGTLWESPAAPRADVAVINLCGLEPALPDIMRRLRRGRPAPEIILLTDRRHIAQSILGMQMGAFDDLLIPFEAERLVQRMEAALNSRPGRRGPRRVIRGFIAMLGLKGARYRYGEATA